MRGDLPSRNLGEAMKKSYERPTIARRDVLTKVAGVVKTSDKKAPV